MIRVVHHRGEETELGGPELLERWQPGIGGWFWIDIQGEPESSERDILRQFGIHPLAVEDALRKRHPPKVEAFDDFLFILMRGLNADVDGFNFGVIQLSLFIGGNFLITRHGEASMSANALWQSFQEGLQIDSPGAAALQIMGRLTRRYVDLLLDLEHRLDELEVEVFSDPRDALLSELTGYKAKLRNIIRVAGYHARLVEELRGPGCNEYFDGLVHELTDLADQVERSNSLAVMHYDVAGDLTDGYLALTSHRLNRVMQILTVITVIFVPLTFVAGIYGMNFQNMPELGSENGYFVVLGVMLVIALLQLVYFRMRKWV